MSTQRRYRSVRAVTEGTEQDFQKRITDYATAHGWLWAHVPDSRHGAGHPGFPDVVLVRHERLIFAEVKGPRGKVSVFQEDWVYCLGQIGCAQVVVWRPKDWPAIQELLA